MSLNKTKREHANLRLERAGGLLDGFTLTVDGANGPLDGDALAGLDLDAALDALRADGWTLEGEPPRRMGTPGTVRVFLHRDVALPPPPPPPTLEELEAREQQRAAAQLAASKRTRELRELLEGGQMSAEDEAALSPEDRARLAALRLVRKPSDTRAELWRTTQRRLGR